MVQTARGILPALFPKQLSACQDTSLCSRRSSRRKEHKRLFVIRPCNDDGDSNKFKFTTSGHRRPCDCHCPKNNPDPTDPGKSNETAGQTFKSKATFKSKDRRDEINISLMESPAGIVSKSVLPHNVS